MVDQALKPNPEQRARLAALIERAAARGRGEAA